MNFSALRARIGLGDVVLFHSMMPHSVGANLGEDRPVVYFRYGEYENSGQKALTSMWQGSDGLGDNLQHSPELAIELPAL